MKKVCVTCKKRKEIYAKGQCRNCYQRKYQKKRFGEGGSE